MSNIRPLDPATDRAAVADLYDAATDYTTFERGPTPSAELVAELFDETPPVATGGRVWLGDWDGDRLDGIADLIFGYPEPTDAYLGLMVFRPDARRAGRGSALLAEAERVALDRGATRMLVAALAGNARGLGFWRAQGFVLEREFPGQDYGERTHDVLRHVKPL